MICLLFVGLSISLIEIKEKRSEREQAMRVSTPMFGGLNTRHAEGPWPECLTRSANACVNLLALYTDGLGIEIVHPGEVVEEGFRMDRVRIYVDESSIVTAIPRRG